MADAGSFNSKGYKFMKRKIKLLIVFFTLIYLMPALYFDFIAFNNAEYPQMYLYKNIEWYPSLTYRDKGAEYIEGQYTYYGWCYKIEMKVFKNSQTQQVYNYFSGHGTAVNFLIFGKTITRNFYNGVSIRYYDMPETQ